MDVRHHIVVRADGATAMLAKPRTRIDRVKTPMTNLHRFRFMQCIFDFFVPRVRRRGDLPGPDETAPEEFGYQGAAAPQQIYRQGLKQLAGFDKLSPAEQDAKLKQIESGVFFNLLRRNTIEGMFCDPQHGGNVDMVGWQLIGFPGPRMTNYAQVDQYHGEAFRPKPVSLKDVVDHPNRPSEEET